MTIVFKAIKATVGLRASVEEEIMGLDITEHGLTSAYADFLPSYPPKASTVAQGAVMATRPAREAFRHIDTSGLPFFSQVKIMHLQLVQLLLPAGVLRHRRHHRVGGHGRADQVPVLLHLLRGDQCGGETALHEKYKYSSY